MNNLIKKISILILFQLISCSENTKNSQAEKLSSGNQTVSANKKNTEKVVELSKQEEDFNKFLESIKIHKIQPIDTLEAGYNIKQFNKYNIGRNTIKIFRNDDLNIEWIKINSKKFHIKNLKTVNPVVDGKRKEMFCNTTEKIKLFKYNNNEIIFFQFHSSPCTGLGCGVSDYLIYDLQNNKVNLFSSFRSTNLDLYKFPFNKKLNYLSTEYQGDFHGATPIHFISRIYSLDEKGKFQLAKDSTGKEYYYEIITFPNEEAKEIEYKRNWF